LGLQGFHAPPAWAQAPAGEPLPPQGFQLVLADTGVWLFRKDYSQGSPDYVQVIDLSHGARVELMHGPIAEPGQGQGVYGGDNPRFQRLSLERYWDVLTDTSPRAFCVTNGQFFYMPQDPPPIAFPLKVDGQVVSDGYGINEYPEKKLMLEVWPERVDIRELDQTNLYTSNAPDIVAGLHEEANKRAKKFVGRTFFGIDDREGDGWYETVMIFNTLSARQVDAAEVLRSFGAEKVMMLDGGGSAQLICQGQDYVASDRLVPQAVGVFAGPEATPTPPPLEMLEPTPALLIEEANLANLAGAVGSGGLQATQEPTAAPTEEPELVGTPAAAALAGPPQAARLGSPLIVPLAMLPIAGILFFLLMRMRQEDGASYPSD
jgi:hypothetical protein